MFPNECTPEHILGVLVFVFGLLMKGLKNHIRVPRLLVFVKSLLARIFQR